MKKTYQLAILMAFVLILVGCEAVKTPTNKNLVVPEVNQDVSTKQAPVVTNKESTNDYYYIVSKVVDGDTIDVKIDGVAERIRLIGIDTPEVVDPRKPVQCFGVEASNKAKAVLTGQSIALEKDASQGDRDTYGRLLRYIFLKDGTNFNQTMIKGGYAHEYTYNLPYKYQQEFKEAERYAQENKLGLWQENICQTSTADSNSNTNVAPTQPATTDQPVGCVIKGNISSGGKIYHLPGCGSYEKTVIDISAGEHWFCTEAEALAAGWRKALNCN